MKHVLRVCTATSVGTSKRDRDRLPVLIYEYIRVDSHRLRTLDGMDNHKHELIEQWAKRAREGDTFILKEEGDGVHATDILIYVGDFGVYKTSWIKEVVRPEYTLDSVDTRFGTPIRKAGKNDPVTGPGDPDLLAG